MAAIKRLTEVEIYTGILVQAVIYNTIDRLYCTHCCNVCLCYLRKCLW